MNQAKKSNIKKMDYIYKFLNEKKDLDKNLAKRYAQEVANDLDTIQAMLSGARQCPEGDTIPEP